MLICPAPSNCREYVSDEKMHELTLVKNMVSILEKEIDDSSVKEVKTVFLEIGKLKNIVPEILVAGFNNFPKGKKLAKAELKIRVLPVKVKCNECGMETSMDSIDVKCRKCGSYGVNIVSGNEFSIKGIEY